MEKILSPVLLLITLSSLLPPITTAHLTNQELSHAISALRSHSYTLFSKAITESDLHNRLLSSRNSTFTLFSPPDSLISALGLSSRSLLYHVSPLKLPLSHLRKLSSSGGYYVDTLLPRRRILIGNTQVFVNATVLDSVTVDGVRLSVPDLFIGTGVVVHGLDGILVSGFDSEDDEEDYAGDHHLRIVSPPASRPSYEVVAPTVPPVKLKRVSSSKNRRNPRGSHRNGRKSGHGKFSKFKSRIGL
ncbi:hypothetical protein Pint_27091 [Pistacia integerrima]|uniref:Uncharacterized protein n=1 Tax=Pistacia integerrima TaxID=434235 RepID=A0ACC0YSK3_9ROSI|nr:hypothetical protein Pint_27091 [Pistacia integerrima]